MARNKFEEQIKEKLEEREIQPTANAWDQLNTKLDATSSKSKNGYFWYGIAASFIGFLLLSVVYFHSNNSSIQADIQTVDTPKRTSPHNKVQAVEILRANEEFEYSFAFDSIEQVEAEDKVALEDSPSKVANTKVKAIVINSLEYVDLADYKVELPIETIHSHEEILNSKILEVVAQVNSLESKNIDLTDAEVDSLLRIAQTEILLNNRIQNGEKMDAMALLTDVEDQLDQSFRDKLFDRLKIGFVRVRTAVADSDR